MIGVSALRKVFREKLERTDNLDAAFVKAVWTAYKLGLADAPAVAFATTPAAGAPVEAVEKMAQARLSDGPQEGGEQMKGAKFLVVMAVPNHLDDWEVTGVFSNDRDAAEFAAGAKSSGEFRAVADPQRMPMGAILDVLVRDRLASLAEPILKLASQGTQGTQDTQGVSYPRSALNDAFRLAGLIQLCGSAHDGTNTTVRLSQDDATGCWVLTVVGQKGFVGATPREAIDEAIKFNKENLS